MSYNIASQQGSARDAVYMQLREQIVSLGLPPGSALSEKETSLQFNVSRTPVRESFVRLAQEGLVQVLPQRGTFVALIDPNMVEEARFMREHLERAVIRLACDSFPARLLDSLDRNLREQEHSMDQADFKRMFELDEQFHLTLFEGCGKLHTWAAMRPLVDHLNRSRLLRLASDRHWQQLYRQHSELVAAIRARDGDTAECIMKEHLTLNIADLKTLQLKFPHYFVQR